jgi:hypothetical protein
MNGGPRARTAAAQGSWIARRGVKTRAIAIHVESPSTWETWRFSQVTTSRRSQRGTPWASRRGAKIFPRDSQTHEPASATLPRKMTPHHDATIETAAKRPYCRPQPSWTPPGVPPHWRPTTAAPATISSRAGHVSSVSQIVRSPGLSTRRGPSRRTRRSRRASPDSAGAVLGLDMRSLSWRSPVSGRAIERRLATREHEPRNNFRHGLSTTSPRESAYAGDCARTVHCAAIGAAAASFEEPRAPRLPVRRGRRAPRARGTSVALRSSRRPSPDHFRRRTPWTEG